MAAIGALFQDRARCRAGVAGDLAGAIMMKTIGLVLLALMIIVVMALVFPDTGNDVAGRAFDLVRDLLSPVGDFVARWVEPLFRW